MDRRQGGGWGSCCLKLEVWLRVVVVVVVVVNRQLDKQIISCTDMTCGRRVGVNKHVMKNMEGS